MDYAYFIALMEECHRFLNRPFMPCFGAGACFAIDRCCFNIRMCCTAYLNAMGRAGMAG